MTFASDIERKMKLTRPLLILLAAICLSSCSERFEAIMNPYGRPVEDYPKNLDIPAEGGSITLSFESNFDFAYSFRHDTSGFQLSEDMQEYSTYHRRLDLTLTAQQNNTGKELTDTLWVAYLFPTFLLPIRAEKIIGEYVIRQSPSTKVPQHI